MRGNVFRLDRRRAASIFLAVAAALLVAVGSASARPAKARSGPHKPAPVAHRGVGASKVHKSAVGHAAGHKIA